MAEDSNSAGRAAANKQIDEYYRACLTGLLASSLTSRNPKAVAKGAMEQAMAAYGLRCEVLGQTFSRAI